MHQRHPNLLQGLPNEIARKIHKTSQTRGAQPYERVPYQNRVNRSNRVVVPFRFRTVAPPAGYGNGSVIMVRPRDYLDPRTKHRKDGFPNDVVVGENAFIIFDNRRDWESYPPGAYGWRPRRYLVNAEPAKRRRRGGTDDGHYLARVPATTAAAGGEGVVEGDPQGIRFFEYASTDECWKIEAQLAYLAWKTAGIDAVSQGTISNHLLDVLAHEGLNDDARLTRIGALNDQGQTICPLCRVPIEAQELMERIEQMEGREVVDLTVTGATLFHVEALRPGAFNHAAYKVGWGHYYCNTVAGDMGVEKTWEWMVTVLKNAGHLK